MPKLTPSLSASPYLVEMWLCIPLHICTFIGLQIHGHEKTFVVGETATVTCSSDLDVLYIEWHQDKGNTSTSLVTSYKSLNKMMFRPVSAAVNDVQYTCLVMSPYGMQKRSVSFHIESELHGLHAILAFKSSNNVTGFE